MFLLEKCRSDCRLIRSSFGSVRWQIGQWLARCGFLSSSEHNQLLVWPGMCTKKEQERKVLLCSTVYAWSSLSWMEDELLRADADQSEGDILAPPHWSVHTSKCIGVQQCWHLVDLSWRSSWSASDWVTWIGSDWDKRGGWTWLARALGYAAGTPNIICSKCNICRTGGEQWQLARQ